MLNIFNKKKNQESSASRALIEERRKPVKRQRQIEKLKKDLTAEEMKSYVQDVLPIKDIQNGVIETTDGRFVKIVEIEPINFTLRSNEEKFTIISQFSSVLKIPNMVRFQFKAITKQADSQRYIDILMKKTKNEENQKVKSLARNYVNLINELGSNEALTRRFFIIFEYLPTVMIGDRMPTYTEIVAELSALKGSLASYMKACGNSIVDYEAEGKNDTLHTLEVLYSLLNRRTSLNETINKRYERLTNDYAEVMNLDLELDSPPHIPVIDIIAPRGIKFKYDHMLMDGTYYGYLYIEANGYPKNLGMGWASMLTGMGNGVDVDIHIKKEDKHAILPKVSRRIRTHATALKTKNPTASDYEEVRDSLGAAEYLKEMVASGEDFFYFGIVITVSALTLDMLRRKMKAIKRNLETLDILCNEVKFDIKSAFEATLPINNITKGLFEQMKHNTTTTSLASLSYLFTAYEIGDEDGVLLGVNKVNNSLCVVDLFNSRIYKNANMVIIGTSGAGKTFTMQLLALRMRMTGIQVFILAPLKGHEFKRASDAIGGSYIKISTSSPDCINVLEIRKKGESEAEIIDRLLSGEEEDSILSHKIQQLSIFFKLLIKDITQEQRVTIEKALLKTYAKKGITQDNNSLFIPGTDTYKEMPILGDLYNELKALNDGKMDSVINIMEQFVSGSAKNMNKQTNVNLDNKYVVIDISTLSDELLPVGMFLGLDYCWDKIKEDRTKKKAIFIDETWKLINTDPLAANFVLEIFKIIRGYGGSSIAATQDMNDFYSLEDGKYGKGIINNSKTKIILNLEQEEIDVIKEPFKLSRSEMASIANFSQGQALLSTNNNKVPIIVKPSQKEKELITTDRRELAALADKLASEQAQAKAKAKMRPKTKAEMTEEEKSEFFKTGIAPMVEI